MASSPTRSAASPWPSRRAPAPTRPRATSKLALRKEGGFQFQIRAGRLRLGAPGKPASALREVDFSGGTADIRKVERGSDAFRRLADFGERRKLSLALEAPDGTRLSSRSRSVRSPLAWLRGPASSSAACAGGWGGSRSRSHRRPARAALDALHSGAARNLKTGRRKQLYPLDLRGRGAPDHLLKVNDYGRAAGLRRALRGSKARHELQMAEQVAARGIPTVVPLAAGERRSGGLLRTCYLLMPILEDVAGPAPALAGGELAAP